MVKIIISIFVTFIIFYIICFLDTNNTIHEFKKIVSEQKITNIAFDRYVGNYNEAKGPATYSKIKINRRFVIHNFYKGIMYVKYSYEHYNNKGERIGGSWNIPSKWLIEKREKQWVVKFIEENP